MHKTVRIAVFLTQNKVPEILSTNPPPRSSFGVIRDFTSGCRVAAGLEVGNSPFCLDRRNEQFVPCRGKSAGRRSYRRKSSFWRWLSIVVVGVASSEFKAPGRFSPNSLGSGCGIGLRFDRLRCEPQSPTFADCGCGAMASQQTSHIRALSLDSS